MFGWTEEKSGRGEFTAGSFAKLKDNQSLSPGSHDGGHFLKFKSLQRGSIIMTLFVLTFTKNERFIKRAKNLSFKSDVNGSRDPTYSHSCHNFA